MTDVIGWISSFILLLTLARQVYTQWKENTSKGVSKWLYIGQVFASIGFIVYSWIVDNWVFVVTNSLILLNTFVGLAILLRHRRREERDGARGEPSENQGARPS